MQPTKLHVLGNADEALIVGIPKPQENDLKHLSTECKKAVTVICEAAPDQLMTSVLAELDTWGKAGDTIISNPMKEIHGLIIAFTNGWNAFCSAYKKVWEKQNDEVLNRWKLNGFDPTSIDGFRLSDLTMDMLRKAAIGLPPPELHNVIVGAIDQLDVHDWYHAVMSAFKDGWNAARQELAKK